GGAWARPRLLLWTAWVALRRQHPEETTLRLDNVRSMPVTLSARDRLLRDAVILAHTRRYGDASTLQTVWQRTRDDVLHVEPDLFSLHPIAEFVGTAAIVGDADRFDAAFAAALAVTDRLGDPPVWSAPLHWTGVQRGILLGRTSELAAHARALVAAAPHNRVAAAMSTAGRVWTEILTGTVDTDAIESAATRLARVGLAWDGARLASHGAGHTQDRRIVARLLSTARLLHPNLDSTDDATPDAARSARPHGPLSARELEVAALVIAGKTYAEIGETIFISPRTAEHHIARIRRRLGATSRSDLIAKLRGIVEDSGPSRPSPQADRDDPPTDSPSAP
ncbi:MAG: gerE, partial [Microbacterium sp.]|nr:gerE [Microbacterium sp.]